MGIRILVPRPRLLRHRGKPLRFFWLCAGLAAWALAYSLFAADGLAGVMRARRQASELEQQIERAREGNALLRARIDALRHDPEAIEREARERLYLARPGETIYLLPSPPAESPRGPDRAGEEPAPRPPSSPSPDGASER